MKQTTQELRKMVIEFTKEELENEIWLPIKGFEEYYEVSSLGRFRSNSRKIVRSNGIVENKPARVLKNNYYSNGYVQLILYVEKVRYNFIAHRVISEHFISNPKNLKVVNHKNFIKWDNRVSNLEWCTSSENLLHAHQNKTWKKNPACGEKIGSSKLNEGDVRYIKENFNQVGMNKDLFDKFKHKIRRPAMNNIGHNITWKHIII